MDPAEDKDINPQKGFEPLEESVSKREMGLIDSFQNVPKLSVPKARAKRGKTKFTHFKSKSPGGKKYKPAETNKNLLNTEVNVLLPNTEPENAQISDISSDVKSEISEFERTSFLTYNADTGTTLMVIPVAESSTSKDTATASSSTNKTSSGGLQDNPLLNLTAAKEDHAEAKIVEKPHILLIEEVLFELQKQLPYPCVCFREEHGVNVLLLARNQERAVQRRAYFSFSGEEAITVHHKPLANDVLKELYGLIGNRGVILTVQGKDPFIERILKVVQRLRSYEVCVGVDNAEFKPLWQTDKFGNIDKNPYGESRFSETFRPFGCKLLVSISQYMKRRCSVCIKTKIRFRGKIGKHQTVDALPNTPNIHLDRDQLIFKVKKAQKELHYARSQIVKLKAEIGRRVNSDGNLDDELSENICM